MTIKTKEYREGYLDGVRDGLLHAIEVLGLNDEAAQKLQAAEFEMEKALYDSIAKEMDERLKGHMRRLNRV